METSKKEKLFLVTKKLFVRPLVRIDGRFYWDNGNYGISAEPCSPHGPIFDTREEAAGYVKMREREENEERKAAKRAFFKRRAMCRHASLEIVSHEESRCLDCGEYIFIPDL